MAPEVTVYDPWASEDEVMHEYKLDASNELPSQKFNAVILAVAHKEFLELNIPELLLDGGVIYDVKGLLPELQAKRL